MTAVLDLSRAPQGPRFQALEAHWLPTLDYVHGHQSLIRELVEDHGLVLLQLNGDSITGAFDASTELKLDSTSVKVTCSSGSLPDRLADVFLRVEQAVQPTPFRVSADLQFLEPLESPSFDDAAQQATRSWLASVALPGAVLDCAVLVDGTDEVSRAHYQAEFGIVDHQQAAKRLAREVGRMRHHGPRRSSHRDEELPAVALFADIQWWALDPSWTLQDVWAFRHSTLDFSATFVSSLSGGVRIGHANTPQTEVS